MQPPPPAGSGPSATGPGGRPLASFGSRFLAMLIDGVIGYIAYLPGFLFMRFDNGFLSFIGGLLSLAGAIGYIYLYCQKVAAGHSWGQQVAKVQVVSTLNGGLLTPMQVFVRQLAKIISAIPCYLGFLWMLWDPEKKTWHDKLVNTQVVVG